MLEIETMYVNKKSLNSASIIFDDKDKADAWSKILIKERVGNVPIIFIHDSKKYYGFRMYRMKYQFLKLMLNLKNILEGE